MSVAPNAGIVALDNFTSPTGDVDGQQGQVPKPLAGQQNHILSASGWIPSSTSSGTVTSVAATAGTGINVTGSPITTSGTLVITNTAPDQVVGLTAGTGINVTGTYPNFTIVNTSPSSGGTVTSVSGTGTVNGISLSGTVTSSGSLTLGGTLTGVDLTSQVTGLLPVANGGTNASTTNGARSSLGAAASGANTDITSIALTTGTITGTPTSTNDIVNKSYADSIATGVNFHPACQYATTADLGSVTYNNGTSGVGATLTNAGAQAALAIDGHTFTATDVTNATRVLLKNESNAAYNGVYTVTNQGSGLTNWVLTRATDYDTSGSGTNEVDAGDMILVLAGTVNANTSWVQQTPLPITIGTTNITFIQFAAVQTYTAGTGLSLITNQFSITNTGTAGTYGSASAVPVITTNAQGQVTSVTNTNIAISGSAVSGNISGNAANVTGTVAIGNGGTGQTTQQSALNALAGAVTSGSYLRGNGTNVSMSAIQASDVPTLNQNTTGTASNVTGTVAIGNGGTGQTTQQAALTALAGTQVSGQYLRSNGTNTLLSAIQAADVPTLNQNTTGQAGSVANTLTISSPLSGTSFNGSAATTIALASGYGDTQNPYASKTANFFLAAPNGSAGVPTFRAIVSADIPTLNQNTTGTASNVTGTVAIGNGGTGETTRQAAMDALAGATTSGFYLRGNGTDVQMSAIQAADVPTLNQNTTGTASNITATTNSTLTTLSALSLPGSQVSGNISGNANNVTGTVAIANGGTGQTSASAAFNALSPITTTGDLIIGNGTNSATSLPIGANTYVLTSNGTTAAWAPAASGSGTVTSVSGTGTVSGISLSGTVTTSGSLTLGGTLSLASPPTIGNTTPNTIAGTNISSATSPTNTLAALSLTGTPNAATGGKVGVLSIGPNFSASDKNILASLVQNINDYTQIIVQNSNAGTAASADFVVNNDNTTGAGTYGDFGINSSAYSGTGAFAAPNAIYLYSQGGDLVIGTQSANVINFAIGSATAATIGSITATGINNFPIGATTPAAITGTTITDSIGNVRTIVQNPQSGATSYTLVATDAGKHIYVTGTGGVTCPVSVFGVGQAITIVNNTAASITITAPSAGTLYLAGTATTGNRTLAQRGLATLLYVVGGATPTVIASGAGLS